MIAQVDERTRYQPFGAAERLFYCRDDEVLLSGPAGTGKTRAILEKLYFCLMHWPGMRALIVRKTRQSLTQSALVIFDHAVIPADAPIALHHGSQEYRHDNGSIVALGGMDKPSRIMSTEFDMIIVPEATELTENDWETLTSRLRNGVMPFQQIIGDCNPDAPHHWLKQRCDSGRCTMIESRHEDNPTVTPAYLSRLDNLTGVRYLRLRKGLWVAAEGLVYDTYDPAVHLIDSFDIPPEWPRVWAVDFGYTHPFVWQAWAGDPDGRLYRYREIYMTKRLVEDHAADILGVTQGEPRPVSIICDHNAEDRATLERHLGMKTTPAYKAVTFGIQTFSERLRVRPDGKPRVYLMRDALVERDQTLVDAHHPTCLEEEMTSYVWDTGMGRRKGEQPVKEFDHSCDASRYVCATIEAPYDADQTLVFEDRVAISPF